MRRSFIAILLLVIVPFANGKANGEWINNCADSRPMTLTHEREKTSGSGNPKFMAYVFLIHPEEQRAQSLRLASS